MGNKSMKNLWENITNSIEKWLDNLQADWGIAPSTTLVIIGILLVLLIFMISNAKKHKKLKKMAEQNQAAAQYLKDNMDVVLEGMDSIEDSLMDLGDKLVEMEKSNELQNQMHDVKGQNQSTQVQGQTPSIIYIDNRQGASSDRVKPEEILKNVSDISANSLEQIRDKAKNEIAPEFKGANKESPFEYVENETQVEDEIQAGEEIQVKETTPRAIYTDRTSGVSKSGKEYTLEQLQKQIKE